jgi:hypothetical protein
LRGRDRRIESERLRLASRGRVRREREREERRDGVNQMRREMPVVNGQQEKKNKQVDG